ncbi:MAG: ROK family protein [Chloroflexota bacterium]|nr:ROK family protein [Chloroflexota bacterium]
MIASFRTNVNVRKIINYAILERMSIYIAIDIGGTRMRAAAFPSDGFDPLRIKLPSQGSDCSDEVFHRRADGTRYRIKKIPSQKSGTTPQERLIELIDSVAPESESITAIGVAAPGPLDPQAGVVFTAPNIPAFKNFPIVDYLGKHFQVPISLDNDANLAAVGEWKAGAGKGYNNLIYLTISTGIGGGIITDGKLLHGASGIAAELGHVTILPDGPVCGCGHRGHIEAIASGTGIARWVQKEISQGAQSSLSKTKDISAKNIAAAAKQGDKLAKAAFERAGYFLGLTLTNLLHIFNPSIVIFGGGVSQSGELLLDPVKRCIQKNVFTPKYLENLTITTASLGDDAGLIGALILARNISKQI